MSSNQLTGPLRIYRVPGSVSFLHSGNLLHAILPRSQCWCVDAQSKFVFRKSPSSYYRIELPFEVAEDKEKVEEIKLVFEKVLQYEKTPCPFHRGFHVDLPEQPVTPARRRTVRSTEKAKKWKRQSGVWEPEDGRPALTPSSADASDASTLSASEQEEDRRSSFAGSSVGEPEPESDPVEEPSPVQESRLAICKTAVRPSPLSTGRSITAPPQVISPTFQRAPAVTSLQAVREDSASGSESVDSFHTVADEEEPSIPKGDAAADDQTADVVPVADALPSSIPSMSTSSRRGGHKRDISELTITASNDFDKNMTPRLPNSEDDRPLSSPSTPPLVSDDEDTFEPAFSDIQTPPDTLRLRKLGKTIERTASPMPHPANLFTPPSRSVGQRLTQALIDKTCAILLGPPAHLVALMLRIASRIANGGLNVVSFNLANKGQKIPCSWESSGDEEDEWDEDDFGMPLSNVSSGSSRVKGSGSGPSREVD